jgi:hypothetical protein
MNLKFTSGNELLYGFVSNNAGFTERVLCVAEAINQAALFEKEKVS